MNDIKEVFALGPNADDDDVWLTEYTTTATAVLRAGDKADDPRGGCAMTPERARALAAKLMTWAASKDGGPKLRGIPTPAGGWP